MNKYLLFKLVCRGWFVGMSVLFTLLFAILMFVDPAFDTVPVYTVVMIPIIAALQGVILGGIVCLGLTIWPQKNKRGTE